MFSFTRSSVLAALAFAVAGGFVLAAETTAPAVGTNVSNVPADYKGIPYADEKYKDGAQKIPGTVYCAYYDMVDAEDKENGEGITYHDLGKKNEGSGGLNGGGKKYVDMYRRNQGVDISYTKDFADKWEGQKAFPPMDMLYVGWTDEKEWINLTVDVAEEGTYTIDLLYTSNHGGELSLDLNGKEAVKSIMIETTNDAKDTTGWRQWHHWNLAKNCAEIKLPKGKSVLTLHVVKEGNMNLGTMEFKKKG